MKLFYGLTLSMMPATSGGIYFDEVPDSVVADLAREGSLRSYVGDPQMSSIITSEIGPIATTTHLDSGLDHGETIIVAEYVGPKLREDAVALPSGGEIRYYFVHLK